MSHKQAKAERRAKRKADTEAAARRGRLESSSHRRKLAWAERHIQTFEAAVTEWSRDGYRITEESDGEGRVTVLGQLTQAVPDELSLIAGDSLQCLRHSLDHMVFALSKKGTPTMNADDEEIPQFPIFRDVTKPIVSTNRGLKFLKPRARQAVLDLTPNPTLSDYRNDPLWLLNKMGNRDKHRSIPLLAVSHHVRWSLANAAIEDMFIGGGDILEVGAQPVVIVQYRGSFGRYNEISPTPIVQFGPGVEMEGRPVALILRWVHDHIRDTVFQRLEQYL